MELPRSVVIGHDALEQVVDVCARLRLGKAGLIVADPTTFKVAGERVKAALEASGLRAGEFLISEATVAIVDEVAGILTAGGYEFAIGVGGGRPIDVAKCAATKAHLPYLSVPTAASHDGVVSARASIFDERGKVSLAANAPIGVIMDTKIIASSPFRLLAAGCGDIISNSTAVKDWLLAHNLRHESYSTYAAALSEMTAQMVIENAHGIKPGLEESAWFVSKALVSSGVAMSIAGSSRPASGSEHKFSHALDMVAKKPALHGEQCGVGAVIMMALHGGDWKKIKTALATIGAPTNAKELGVTGEEVLEALEIAHKIAPERYTILGDRGLSHEAAERLATTTGVI